MELLSAMSFEAILTSACSVFSFASNKFDYMKEDELLVSLESAVSPSQISEGHGDSAFA